MTRINYRFCALTDGFAIAGIIAIIGWLVVALLYVYQWATGEVLP